ncbi:hypothetical protein QQ045_015631 [Rhodiola kirilowii]
MDKGKRVIRRTENVRTQQGTFNRRCESLFTQANELAAVCDADVGIIVFSNSGDMSLYCNETSSLERVVDRYKSRTGSEALRSQQHYTDPASSILGELVELRDGISNIAHSLVNYTSVDNWRHMKLNDMDRLERELRSAITEVQVRKDQLLQQELKILQKREQMLAEENQRMYNLIHVYDAGRQQQDQQDLLQTMVVASSSQHQVQNDVLNQFPFAGEEQPSIVLHLATLQPLFDPHHHQQQQNREIKLEDQPSFSCHGSDFHTSFNPPSL